MANTRKVLINRHSTKQAAPLYSEMYHGEIAVSHPSADASATTIYTRNENVMVPFISCAQTIAIIDGKIAAADVTYDVKAAQNDAHVEVATGGTASAKEFTVSSKDVMSEEEFEAYSARTAEALEDLMDMLITAVTGEGVIEVEPETTGATGYNIKHKEAKEVALGFNKVATDEYGHVIDYSAVTADDINAVVNVAELSAATKALSAGTIQLSADTVAYVDDQIDEVYASAVSYTDAAIEALDSSVSAATGKYFTALAIENGKLVAKEEADIPVLSVESAGTGNVVASITVADHKITYQTASVATSEGIAALSASVVSLSAVTGEFSGATDSRINDLSGYTEAVDDKVEKLSAATISISGFAHGEIAELSAATSAVSVDVENLSAATLALSAVTLTGVSLNNTPLAVNNHIVSVPVTTSGSGIAGAAAADSGSMASAIAVKEYVEDTLSSAVEYKGATGATPSNPAKGDLYIASSDFVVEGSKSAETGDFIIYDGTKWDVIEKNLDGAITGNLTQDTVTLGDSTNSVKSLANGSAGQVLTIGTAGTPVWADDPVLSTAVTGNGNVFSTIQVSDHEITMGKDFTAATNADLEIVSGIVDTFSAATVAEFNSAFTAINALSADAHNSMIARDDAVFSSAVTYVDDQIDEVYASAVSYADSAITYAIEGLDSTGSVSTTGHYMTSVTITDGKITAVGEEEVPAATPVTTVAGTTGDTAAAVLSEIVTGGTDGHQLTLNMTNKVFSASTADEAVKVKSALTINILTSAGTTASTSTFDGHENVTVDIPGSHDTATTEDGHYAPSTTASSLDAAAGTVLNKVTLDSKNHVISAGTTDKINSASTADSADKVANKLTMTDETNSQDYDGSAAKSLTFGTATTSTGVNGRSMSMTSAGVVDVEIIDCGEY